MGEELNMTPKRLELLAAVAEGRVSWNASNARYILDGQEANGPDHRALSTMARHGWILRAGAVVKLTTAGSQARN